MSIQSNMSVQSNEASPPCPLCAGTMVTKETHFDRGLDAEVRIYKCTACGVEYPKVIPAGSNLPAGNPDSVAVPLPAALLEPER